MRATDVAAGAPVWVYGLLVALVMLGVRRLRTRETPVAVALLPSIAFLVWSLVGVDMLAAHAGPALAIGAWVAGAAIGGAGGVLLPDPRGERLPGGRVRQPGSWSPLILYLGVFAVRFACGAWAAIRPADATTATVLGLAVGAAVTARLWMGVARWRPVGAAHGGAGSKFSSAVRPG